MRYTLMVVSWGLVAATPADAQRVIPPSRSLAPHLEQQTQWDVISTPGRCAAYAKAGDAFWLLISRIPGKEGWQGAVVFLPTEWAHGIRLSHLNYHVTFERSGQPVGRFSSEVDVSATLQTPQWSWFEGSPEYEDIDQIYFRGNQRIGNAMHFRQAYVRLSSLSYATRRVRRCASNHSAFDRGSGRLAVTQPAPIGDLAIALQQGIYYTPRARKLHGHGTYRFQISANGKVSDCIIMDSSGDPELDEAGCSAISSVPFTPARDAAGQPTLSYWNRSVTW